VAYLEGQMKIKVMDNELIPENLDSVESITRFVESKRAEMSA